LFLLSHFEIDVKFGRWFRGKCRFANHLSSARRVATTINALAAQVHLDQARKEAAAA